VPWAEGRAFAVENPEERVVELKPQAWTLATAFDGEGQRPAGEEHRADADTPASFSSQRGGALPDEPSERGVDSRRSLRGGSMRPLQP
jgi:hypothetical protein